MGDERRISPRWRTVLTGAVVCLLLGNAVALGALEPEGSAPGTAAPVATTAPSLSVPPPEAAATTSSTLAPGTKPAKGSQKPQSSSSQPGTAAPTTTAPADGFRYEVTVTPLCVTTGAPLTVTLRLRPKLGGVLIASYADGGSHGTQKAGWAEDDGLLTFTGPAAPVTGPATLLTQAADEEKRTGSTSVEFKVVGAGEPC